MKKQLRAYFPSQDVFRIWFILTGTVFGAGLLLRFWHLGNALLDPHPIRQTQTALTALLFSQGKASVWDYRSPYDGKLWNFVHEFPLYQWLVSLPMRLGLPFEISARITTIIFFFIGFFFFLRLVERLTDERTVPWAALAYLASPFCIVYSRTCLVDFTALAFLLASFDFAFRALETKRKDFYMAVVVAGVLGGLAAVIKTNLWFSPILFFTLFVLIKTARKEIPLQKGLWVAGQALFQLVVAVAWIRWTISVRGQSGVVLGADTQAWILGPLEMRFHWHSWNVLLTTWVRSVWNDWMIVPALLAFLSPYRNVAFIFLGITLFSVLATFNVHVVHDYYFIGEVPYLFAIVGMGLGFAVNTLATKASKKNLAWRRLSVATLSLAAVLVVSRVPKLPIFFEPLFYNYHSRLYAEKELKTQTAPDDLIYWEGGTEQWEVPLYSQRNVLLSPYLSGAKDLRPTVYRGNNKTNFASLLEKESEWWVDAASKKSVLIRVEEKGKFFYDPSHQLWMGNEPDPRPAKTAQAIAGSSWDTCNKDQWIELKRSSFSGGIVQLRAGERVMEFPWKPFVHLPSKSRLGCHFHFGSETRSAASSKTEM
jgi:hypothetical protein